MSKQNKQEIVAKAEMLIRKRVDEVFEAFVDPAVTSKFWFTKSSGRLEPGKQVKWEWGMFGVSTQVSVKALEENERILIEWPAADGTLTTVEWIFTPHSDDTTYVNITETGFNGEIEEIADQAINSTEAFTLVLTGAKALLEHDLILNLVSDHFPDGLGGQ